MRLRESRWEPGQRTFLFGKMSDFLIPYFRMEEVKTQCVICKLLKNMTIFVLGVIVGIFIVFIYTI